MIPRTDSLFSLAALVGGLLLTAGCGGPSRDSTGETNRGSSAAEATYVAPGEKDKYYLFYSGGHSGQVFVAGLPSMRHISTIPVFSPYPGTGYGFDEETRAMLGEYTWGDVHHPGLSKTDGLYDGRWLFVNDNANNRVARIELRDFKTHEILGPIPNSSAITAPPLSPRIPNTFSSRPGFRCPCQRDGSPTWKNTRTNSTAWSAGSPSTRKPVR